MRFSTRRFMCASLVFLVSLASIPGSAQEAPAKGPRKAYGRGAPFASDDLPDGKLKAGLQTLAPEAKDKAMQWLHKFSFSALDAKHHLRVDNSGGIYYVCPDNHGMCDGHGDGKDSGSEIPEAYAPEEPAATATTASKGPVPVSSPPVYHSKTGAPYVIYIDFNGALVPNTTSWGGPPGGWNCYAWSTDGDRTTFSDSEQADIRRMWERLAEDYAPFNVDVTTDAAFDPDNYTGDKDKVGWLLVTETTDANSNPLPHNGSGGIAYVGVFGDNNFHSSYQPAWVKPMGVANTAEAASHEMGHNMGLSHDGTSSQEYYGGHGSGDTSWGPIMGTGYGRNVSQWSKGEYYNSSQSQDDLTIISARVPYRTDDHAGTHGSATEITLAGDNSFSADGIIETTGEKDVFWFATGAGAITVNATPYVCDTGTKGGNLDIALQLYDSTATLVASNNPATATTASIATTVPAGTYFIHVTPSPAGDPMNANPSGYTVYGSLGQYTVSGTGILPGIGVAETGGSTEVTEGGATDTYSLSLGTPPIADVVITVSPDSQVSVDKPSVTFTPLNWSTAQVVTVSAVDDAVEEGPHVGTITHTASSSDPAFNGIDVASVSAVVTDNDYIGVTVPNGGETWVANSSRTITWFSLLGGNVKIELLKNGALYSTIAASTANTGSYSWPIPSNQPAGNDYKIRITSVGSPSITDSSDNDFTVISPIYYAGMDVNPGWSLNTGWAFGQPTGGQQDTYGNPDPTSGYDGPNVIGYALSGDYGANIPNTRWATTPTIDCSNHENVKLSFQRWLGVEESTYDHAYIEVSNNGSSWVRVWENPNSRVDDSAWTYCEYDISAVADGQSTVSIRWGMGTTDGSWQWCGWNIDEVIVDGDSTLPANGVSITESDDSTDVSEDGAQDTYTVALISMPSANVTVNITPDSQVQVSPTVLTFTTTDWATPQPVTVSAVDDAVHELMHIGNIAHSATSSDTNYNGIGISGVLVNITDNDNSAPTVNAGPDQVIFMTGLSWTPSQLSPFAWYDADDSGTLWQDTGGLTPATTAVGRWDDKSGRGLHMTQASNGKKPTTGIATNQINGLNTLTFDGNANGLLADVMATSAQPFGSQIRNATVVTVFNIKSITDGVTFSLSGTPSGDNQRWQSQAPASSGRVNFDCGGTNVGTTRLSYDSGWSANDNKLMGYVCSTDQDTQELWENGTRIEKDTTGHSVVAGSGGMLLGADGTSLLSKYDNVAFGEMIIINGTLITDDRQLLEGFLAHKWGLTADLPSDHPYKTLNPNGSFGTATLSGTIGDPDGDPLSLTWTQVGGPATATLVNSNAVETVATFGMAGTYTFRLTVDDTITQVWDEVVITVYDGTDSDSDGMADSWETTHFGGTGGTDGTGDQDGDGFIDLYEFLAGTSPTNGNSLLALESVIPVGGTGLVLSWQAVGGKTYELLSSTNLTLPTWQSLVTGIPGTPPTTTYTNTSTSGMRYYKIQLELP